MEDILSFVKELSPLGVIALLAVAIIYLIKNGALIIKMRGTQVNDKDKVSNKEITDNVDMMVLNTKLDKIANNHLHELPEMKKTLDRIESTQTKQGERLAVVETTVKILLNQ